MPGNNERVASASRRGALKLAGASLAATALAPAGVSAQLPEQANTEALNIVGKGIDRKLDVFNIDLLEEQAKQVYGHGTYVFVANGSGKMWTLAENQRAWGDFVFTPNRMGGVVRDQIDLSVELLGVKLPHPLVITPFGSHGLHHPLAEVATAKGIAMSGGLLTVSSASTASMEDIARASEGPKWFQIYLTTDDGVNRGLLERAKAAGFQAIVLTIDAIGQGSSDEYQRLGKPRPWLPYGNFPDARQPPFKTDLGWKDVETIRNITGLPVVVKGVTRPEDAKAAISAGAGAIQVSNHGGRALDGTPASISVMPSIAEAVKGTVPLILDSGIRRGTDVVKALALGADAVAVGRPVMFGLALGGASGVDSVIRFLHRETVDTALHCGVNRIVDLDSKHVRRAAVPGSHGPVKAGTERLG